MRRNFTLEILIYISGDNGRWVPKNGRWVAKFVAHLLAMAALWVRIQTSPKKYEMGDISKEVANSL
jgi:hypothetical protein